eukprot:9972539-Ditylum_brightwellii.AAC.1
MVLMTTATLKLTGRSTSGRTAGPSSLIDMKAREEHELEKVRVSTVAHHVKLMKGKKEDKEDFRREL